MHRLLALAVVAALALGACDTGPPGFDVAGLEADIDAGLRPQYEQSGLTLFGVSCPRSAAEASTGDIFACTAEVERQFVRVRVEADGTDGWTWTTLDLVLAMRETEELIAQEISAQLADAITLDCGSPNLRVLALGSEIVCTARDSGRNERSALLTVNGPGQTAWELLG